MPQTPLFTTDDLSNWLGEPVPDGRAEAIERVVWGWLRPLLKVEERPDPASAELLAWAVELGAIAKENPTGLSAKDIGPFKEQYSSERRDEILRMVASGGTTAPGAALSPEGSFPAPQPYPDPVERC